MSYFFGLSGWIKFSRIARLGSLLEGKQVMKLAEILDEITGNHRGATTEDIRNIFGEYHNLLRWLTGFLIGDEKLADDCMVDACTIAETQTPEFHEWLIHWAARATVGCARQRQYAQLAELASKYERSEAAPEKHPPISTEHLLSLVKNSDDIHARLDVLCRFVLVLRGIANDSYEDVATQLGISFTAAQRAYCVAFDIIELTRDGVPCNADAAGCHVNY